MTRLSIQREMNRTKAAMKVAPNEEHRRKLAMHGIYLAELFLKIPPAVVEYRLDNFHIPAPKKRDRQHIAKADHISTHEKFKDNYFGY